MKSRNIRVAVLAHMSGSYGGVAYFRGLIPALGQYGKDTDFIVITANDDLNLTKLADNVQIRKLAFPKYGGRYVRLLWEQTVLARQLEKFDIDVIYTATNIGLLSSRKPCVIAVRNMDPLVPKTGPEPLGVSLRSRLRGFMSNISINKSTRIVAVSGFVKDFLINSGVEPDKIDIVYHGVDDLAPLSSFDTESPENDQPYIFAASKFVRYANLDTLVRTYHQMRIFGFPGRLKIAGGPYDSVYEHEIHALVNKLGLTAHIDFLGYLTRERIQKMMQECSVFLHASKLEACPFTVLEAMYQGVPIVTTTAGPMKEICSDSAMYVDPDDYVSFAKAAYDIYTSADKSNILRQKARLRAQKFTWENSVTQLVDTLHRAANASA